MRKKGTGKRRTGMYLCLALAGLVPAVGGCTTQVPVSHPVMRAAPMVSNQVIIKFKPEVSNPADPAFLQKLSADIGVPLIYVRPMSGGAHVLRFGEKLDRAQVDAALQALNREPSIVYAEEDRIVRPARS